MKRPDASNALARIRSLPAAEPLTRRLGGLSGVFVVGGAVRDVLLGESPSDIDLVVEGDPAAALERLDGARLLHDRFGTSTVSVDGFVYHLATARRETYARPGSLPDVTPASLEQDLLRRDFTVNSIAVPLAEDGADELIESPGALDDLAARRLRVLHDRSFLDDPTRLLRLARYRARLGFEIEPSTRELAQEAIAAGALRTVSGTRIGNELRLLARERDPVAALAALRELRLDSAIAPRFGLDDDALALRALGLLPNDEHPERLAIALAGRQMPAPELSRLLGTLAFEAPDREAIVATASGAPALARELEAAVRPSAIATAAFGVCAEQVALAGALGPAEAAREWLVRLRHVELQIAGGDLLAAGVPEGPDLGRGLRAALIAKLDGQAQSREEELAAALEGARAGG